MIENMASKDIIREQCVELFSKVPRELRNKTKKGVKEEEKKPENVEVK
jgi:hypothetical protein